MKSILISEIGNNHCGDINVAKNMIKLSKNCGATHVKGQAFDPETLKGSMPKEFYFKCAFSLDQYIELIDFGNSIGIPVFFSIFSEKFEKLKLHQSVHKISASQSKELSTDRDFRLVDSKNMFMSVNGPEILNKGLMRKSAILYASDYMVPNPALANINELRKLGIKRVGYSDHTTGLEYSLMAIQKYNCRIIEKHFTLSRDIKYEDKVFRDCLHAAGPREMEILAKELTK